MRRLLTMTVVAMTLVGVTSGAAVARGELWHFEENRQPGDMANSTTETRPLPAEPAAQPVPFDTLWLAIVGPIALLLVIRTVLTESTWPRHTGPDRVSRNGSGLGDVLTDE